MNYVQMDFIVGILTVIERALQRAVCITITRCYDQAKPVVVMLITHAPALLDQVFESCTERMPVLRHQYRNQQSPANTVKRTLRIEIPAAFNNIDAVENLVGTGAAKMLLYKFPDDSINRVVVIHRR